MPYSHFNFLVESQEFAMLYMVQFIILVHRQMFEMSRHIQSVGPKSVNPPLVRKQEPNGNDNNDA
jgi:hypothetical protein